MKQLLVLATSQHPAAPPSFATQTEYQNTRRHIFSQFLRWFVRPAVGIPDRCNQFGVGCIFAEWCESSISKRVKVLAAKVRDAIWIFYFSHRLNLPDLLGISRVDICPGQDGGGHL